MRRSREGEKEDRESEERKKRRGEEGGDEEVEEDEGEEDGTVEHDQWNGQAGDPLLFVLLAEEKEGGVRGKGKRGEGIWGGRCEWIGVGKKEYGMEEGGGKGSAKGKWRGGCGVSGNE